jgi:signal peptidase I
MAESSPAVQEVAPPRRRRFAAWRGVLETAVLALAIFLGIRLAVQNFKVEGESMVPTLHDGEYIIVNKLAYAFGSPHRGDIVVFRAVPALQPDRDFIKRVIGLPGETVAVHGGTVYINGRGLKEPYISELPDYTFKARVVPKDEYFVLGDNRNNSFDSSRWPSTPWLARKYIIGKALVAYWPPSDVTWFRSPSIGTR